MPKPDGLPDTFEERCPLCQHEGFAWGWLVGRNLEFQYDGQQTLFSTGSKLPAAMCLGCGYVMVFNRMARKQETPLC